MGERADDKATEEPGITTRGDFHAALLWGVQQAVAGDARRIVCVDADFTEWCWDEPALITTLTSWLHRPQRRLELVARNHAQLPRRWPRFSAWRRDWSHAILSWQVPQDWPAELPTVLVADNGVSVHLADAVHWRGHGRRDSRLARVWMERCDAVLQRSEAAYSVRTLGL